MGSSPSSYDHKAGTIAREERDCHDAPTKTRKSSKGEDTCESKPLGMHITAIRRFLSDHPEVATQCLTTAQINRAIVKPESLGTHGPYIDRYIGQKDGHGASLVAPATVFVSHAWKYSFADTVADAMEEHAEKEQDAYFWFDLFTNDQNAIKDIDFDRFIKTYKGAIRDIGNVLVILSPWHDPIHLRRAWCLFEIATALSDKSVEVMIYLPQKEVSSLRFTVKDNSECLIQALSDIQAEKAEATSENDKNELFSVIQNSKGGFSSVNTYVKTKLREWYMKQLRSLVCETEDRNMLGEVGSIFSSFGFYDEALQYITKSLTLMLSILGENHPDVTHSYNNMAIVYQGKGDLDKAMEYHQKSLSIRLSILEENHPDVATSYNNIANVYLAKGDLDKAMEYHQKSLSIRLSVLGGNHPDVATSYNNIATVYVDKGDLDKAVEHIQKSLSIRLSILGENHPDVADSYNSIANVNGLEGHIDKAMEYFQKSLAIKLSVLGDCHPDVVYLYEKIAVLDRRRY